MSPPRCRAAERRRPRRDARRDGPLPEPGGRISATGFPETDTFFLHLDNAAWTPAQGCPLPRAEIAAAVQDRNVPNGESVEPAGTDL